MHNVVIIVSQKISLHFYCVCKRFNWEYCFRKTLMSWCDLKDCLIKKSCYNMSSDCYDENFLMMIHNILVSFVLKIGDNFFLLSMFWKVELKICSTIMSHHDVLCFQQVLRIKLFCWNFLVLKVIMTLVDGISNKNCTHYIWHQ